DYAFIGGDAGAHTFNNLVLTTNGAQSVTATSSAVTGSANITVNPIPATHFSVSAPASVTNGAPFSVVVTALDASNTIVPSYTGAVHLASRRPGPLPAEHTVTGG